MFLLVHAQMQKDIYIIGAKLAQTFLQSASDIEVIREYIIRSGGDYEALAAGLADLAQGLDKLGIETIAKEIIESFIESFVDGLFSWSIGTRETQSMDLEPSLA